MLLHVSSGYELYGEVKNANGVFTIQTRFLHASGIPFLPDRSVLCLVANTKVRRRKRGEEGAGSTVQGQNGCFSIPLQWRSVVAGYKWPASIVLTWLCIMFAHVYFTEGWPFAGVLALCCGPLALFFALFSKIPLVRTASYEEAVRLALRAGVPDAIIAQIQKAYGRHPGCAIVHGLPISSTQVLYVYADEELDAVSAGRLYKQARRFARQCHWSSGEIWPVNVPAADAIVSRDAGLVAALPRHRTAGLREEVLQIASYAAHLRSRFGVNFVVGFYDTVSRRNEDLLLVDSGQPGSVRMQSAVDRLEQLLDLTASP